MNLYRITSIVVSGTDWGDSRAWFAVGDDVPDAVARILAMDPHAADWVGPDADDCRVSVEPIAAGAARA